jgi:hypothetical protein
VNSIARANVGVGALILFPAMTKKTFRKNKGFLKEHSLTLVSVGLLLVWIIGYGMLDPKTHLGAFFGNAIADWSGSVIIILGTKFLYEIGSAESRAARPGRGNRWLSLLRRHSLLLFLGVTGIGWLWLYLRMSPESRWGQVTGNIVSEWGQMAGLVFLTKRLIERGSKESN